MKKLIRNVHVITMDQKSSEYRNGCIAIEGNTIIYVGNCKNIPKDFVPDEVIDGKGKKVALPGFINTHTHVAMTLFRGYANDIPLYDWLSRIWPIEDRMTPDDIYWLSLLGIAEMVASGVTTFADMYMFMDRTAEAVNVSGVRAVLARGLQDTDSRAELRLAESRNLYEKWHNEADGRIRVMIGPHAIYTCSRNYLTKCVELAGGLGVGVHMHVSETRGEVEECIKKYGTTPIQYLNSIGMFEVPFLAVHCVHVSDEDMEILAEKGVHVSHCPASNLKLGSGIAPVDAMLKLGVNVSLGTDSASSNNNLSIMKDMQLAALLVKGIRQDPTLLPAGEVLKMATAGGAKALCWEDQIGSLEVGKKADIILIDIDKPHYRPGKCMLAHLVYSGHSADVNTVIVNGKTLMESGYLRTIELERVYYEVEKIYGRIMG